MQGVIGKKSSFHPRHPSPPALEAGADGKALWAEPSPRPTTRGGAKTAHVPKLRTGCHRNCRRWESCTLAIARRIPTLRRLNMVPSISYMTQTTYEGATKDAQEVGYALTGVRPAGTWDVGNGNHWTLLDCDRRSAQAPRRAMMPNERSGPGGKSGVLAAASVRQGDITARRS